MKYNKLAFIDLETTGLDPERHEIIEIGGLIVKAIPVPGRGPNLEVVDQFEFKIKPEHIETAEPEALRINSYNDMEWLFAHDLKQVLPIIAEKTKDCMMVGQNVSFDWGFLQHAFKKCDLKWPMHYHKIDLITMAFMKNYHEVNRPLERYNLAALAEYYGISNPKAHSALADIQVTFEIYKKLLNL